MLARAWLLALSVLVTTAVVLWILHHPRISGLFHQHVPDRPKRRLFLAAVGFFLAFAVALKGWCERGDSNPHPLRDQILSLTSPTDSKGNQQLGSAIPEQVRQNPQPRRNPDSTPKTTAAAKAKLRKGVRHEFSPTAHYLQTTQTSGYDSCRASGLLEIPCHSRRLSLIDNLLSTACSGLSVPPRSRLIISFHLSAPAGCSQARHLD